MKIFRSRLNKVLIVGKLPLPIGGVRIHVQRLIQDLEKRRFPDFHFYNLDQNTPWKLLVEIQRHNAVHLHTSSPWFQLLTSVYCWLLQKPLIITYHSNWGRYHLAGNIAESISAFFAKIPLVQNNESFSRAKKWNRNTHITSTFIPPLIITPLSELIQHKLLALKSQYRYLFCTNAWNITFDQHGREIYGISDLLEKMACCPSSVLIISDPSGNYQKYIKRHQAAIPENILWISEPHDFWNVLLLSDAFVRNTTTDGTSLSIQEAFCCDCVVFATNTVSRPSRCHLYQDILDLKLEEELEIILNTEGTVGPKPSLTQTVDTLLQLYKALLGSRPNVVE